MVRIIILLYIGKKQTKNDELHIQNKIFALNFLRVRHRQNES